MSSGISISYGGLNLSTPGIVMPVSRNIGNLSQAVIQNMNSAEGSNSVNTAPMYAATSALMANNANFQAGQNANQSQFLTVAQNTAQYQATKIGNQGKGK